MGFKADATRIRNGSIVRLPRPVGSTGRATHAHYFIVVDCPVPIKSGAAISLVGISSSILSDAFDPALHVPMKWRAGGDPETGLSKPSFACVDFVASLSVYEGDDFALEISAEHQGHYVHPEKLHTVVAAFNAWWRRRR